MSKTKTTTVPNLYGYYSTSSSTYYYYNDVLLLCIAPDLSLDWKQIVKKSQVSEKDKGYYSSYTLMNDQDELHFVFNERVSANTNIIDFRILNSFKF